MSNERDAEGDTDLFERSQFPAVERPAFQPRIPPDLLDSPNLTRREREVVAALDVMAQQSDFNTAQMLLLNKQVRTLEYRLWKQERWRSLLVSKWSIPAYLALLGLPVIVSKVIENWLKH